MMCSLVDGAKISRVDPELYLKLAALEAIRPVDPAPSSVRLRLARCAPSALGTRRLSSRATASTYDWQRQDGDRFEREACE
jgi:hypothetical protein